MNRRNATRLLIGLPLGAALGSAHQAAAAAPAWPVLHRNPDGTSVSIPAKPLRILSTSVTLTGSLLAIDAPVVASATNGNRQFFDQWARVAASRKVQRLWPLNAVDLEAVHMLQPDLIVVSHGGADSARDAVRELAKIAPTIVVDYATQSWQDVTMLLARATGLTSAAEQRIAEFNQTSQRVAASIRVPEGLTTIVSYNGPGTINPVAMPGGSHGTLLASLGFRMESPDPRWHSGLDSPDDFVKAQYEHLSTLKSRTIFLLRRDPDDVQPLLRDRVLASLPAVQARQVIGLGKNSFRIDYYSAHEIIESIRRRFGSGPAAS